VKSCHIAALGILLSAAVAFAQSPRITVDVTTSRMRYADSVDALAVSVAPELSITSRRTSLFAAGMISQLGGATTSSGLVNGSLYPGRRGAFMPELELRVGGSRHSDGSRTGEFLASGRLHVARESVGSWVGIGGGRTWDVAWRDIIRADVGAWLSQERQGVALVFMPTRVDDSIRYADATFALQHTQDRFEVGATLGLRGGDRLPDLPSDRRLWGGAALTYWVAPAVAVIGSVGTYPVDFTQGYPGGRYATIGIRVAPRRLQLSRPSVTVEPPTDALQDFRSRARGAEMELRVLAPGAKSVDVAGDFTSWDSVAMRRQSGGWWLLRLPIPKGTHQMNVRVNGGNWLVPPGLTRITDEFGVVSGLLVVGR